MPTEYRIETARIYFARVLSVAGMVFPRWRVLCGKVHYTRLLAWHKMKTVYCSVIHRFRLHF